MRNRIGRAASPSVGFKLRSGSRLHTSALELAQPLAACTEARKRICDTAAVGTTVRPGVSLSVSSLYVRALIHDKPFAHSRDCHQLPQVLMAGHVKPNRLQIRACL